MGFFFSITLHKEKWATCIYLMKKWMKSIKRSLNRTPYKSRVNIYIYIYIYIVAAGQKRPPILGAIQISRMVYDRQSSLLNT